METKEELPPLTLPSDAEIMHKVMSEIGHHDDIATPDGYDITTPHLITLPSHRKVEDLTAAHRAAAEYLRPSRRRGVARLADIDSLVAWANRFKGETSALFAKPDLNSPTLTCIADYHASGAPDPTNPKGDPSARHMQHRAVYDFPLSDEWRAWMGVSGQPLEKDVLGEFIEAQAKDVMDPTPAILKGAISDKNEPWENRLIETAMKIEGRYGQLHQLLAMSKRFQVYETADLKVATNRDTGESEIQFLNEHKGPDGKPLNIPNLIIIAIPVFEGGALYRMPVRFRYRKAGAAVKFILSIYNPERAFKAAVEEAAQGARDATGLPLFFGTPETS